MGEKLTFIAVFVPKNRIYFALGLNLQTFVVFYSDEGSVKNEVRRRFGSLCHKFTEVAILEFI